MMEIDEQVHYPKILTEFKFQGHRVWVPAPKYRTSIPTQIVYKAIGGQFHHLTTIAVCCLVQQLCIKLNH